LCGLLLASGCGRIGFGSGGAGADGGPVDARPSATDADDEPPADARTPDPDASPEPDPDAGPGDGDGGDPPPGRPPLLETGIDLSGLVAYWSFDVDTASDGAMFVATSEPGAVGSRAVATLETADARDVITRGFVGNAVDLDGEDDRLVAPDSAAFDLAGPHTLTATSSEAPVDTPAKIPSSPASRRVHSRAFSEPTLMRPSRTLSSSTSGT